jgi:DMSO/TMAO reductase YedYZ molybdopterin-dependent catalytic subunit
MKKTILLILFLVFAAGCVQDVVPLGSVEVREYQGERLDSINNFRENSIKGPQYVNISDYTLKIDGLVNNTLLLSYDDVLNNFQHYSKIVHLYCVEGWDVNILWEGVLVKDLLNSAGVQDGANTVIFHAVDDYTTSHPLDYINDNNILLAFKMNGLTIPPERGYPFMLVAENKWGYKWIKWVDEITVSDNEDYKGFWESRGYSDTGNLDEYFLD